jgi:hypothetical protein
VGRRRPVQPREVTSAGRAVNALVTVTSKGLHDLRTVVSNVDIAQSMYKQYRPGRGVVEIVSGLPDMVSITPFFCAWGVSLRITCKLLKMRLERATQGDCVPSYVLVFIAVTIELTGGYWVEE